MKTYELTVKYHATITYRVRADRMKEAENKWIHADSRGWAAIHEQGRKVTRDELVGIRQLGEA